MDRHVIDEECAACEASEAHDNLILMYVYRYVNNLTATLASDKTRENTASITNQYRSVVQVDNHSVNSLTLTLNVCSS